MEIFFSGQLSESAAEGLVPVAGTPSFLSEEESMHCIKVLRHSKGDTINVIDGAGNMYEAQITDANPRKCCFTITEAHENWGAHGYSLTLVCCPTKNIDRFEWLIEKATEIGIDDIVPAIGEHSERKVIKKERLERILLSAAKQSLKGAVPRIKDSISVSDFLKNDSPDGLKLIAYCFHGSEEDERRSIFEEIDKYFSTTEDAAPHITILIGPEGDFSEKEAELAISRGYLPVSIGESRLRTETAALTSVAAVYSSYYRNIRH